MHMYAAMNGKRTAQLFLYRTLWVKIACGRARSESLVVTRKHEMNKKVRVELVEVRQEKE